MPRKRVKRNHPKQTDSGNKITVKGKNEGIHKTEKTTSHIWYGVFIAITICSLTFVVYYNEHQIKDLVISITAVDKLQKLGQYRIESHQNVSLFERYNVNYTEMLRLRHENMKKYDFNYNLAGVDKRSNLSLQEYRDVYDGKWPVVITDAVSKWKAFNWSGNFFKDNYGEQNAIINIVHGALDTSRTLALPIELFHKQVDKAREDSWSYIADEFFIPQRPQLYSSIGETIYLEEDFFNLFPREVRPWNAQLLWGTAFSRSTLHIDPYNWTGTNAVLSGLKRWKLYPPGQDEHFHVKPGYCGFPLDCIKYNSDADAFNPDLERFPNLAKAKVIEFDQLPGELLLIPTGWFHQAYNAVETIAISSQIMNRNNFRIVLEEILKLSANLRRRNLPYDIDTLPPHEQVKVMMSLLPDEILSKGNLVTETTIQQIRLGNENYLHLLPTESAIRSN